MTAQLILASVPLERFQRMEFDGGTTTELVAANATQISQLSE
jgi:hypothetical protein